MTVWKMLPKNATAPVGVILGVMEEGSVAGVVLRDFAVEKVIQAMDVMDI